MEAAVDFTPAEGQTLYRSTLENVLLCVSSRDSGCLNRGRISIPLEIPARISSEAVRSATLYLRFTPRSVNASVTYRITVAINGYQLACSTVPRGTTASIVPWRRFGSRARRRAGT